MRRVFHPRKGSIIAFSLITLSFILTSGLAVVTVASLERKSGLITQKSVVAFQAADSGAERILERIYIVNSPSFASVPEDGSMTDLTLQDVASNLLAVQSANCDNATDKIVATNNSSPGYTFDVTFYDGTDAIIDCADTTWRDKLVRLRVEGFYRQTARVLELGIKPRPLCGAGDTVTDDDGNTYDLIQIGSQCWMKQNMRVGTMLNTSTAQTDNGTVEKYCFSNQANNCTSNHPNEPDGGLYTWDEAMQYDSTEGAQGICPNGWHVSTDSDWASMIQYLDPTIVDPYASAQPPGTTAGTQLKPGGASGFEGNYAGAITSGTSVGRGTGGEFWTSTLRDATTVWERILISGGFDYSVGHLAALRNNYAISVRCVMD